MKKKSKYDAFNYIFNGTRYRCNWILCDKGERRLQKLKDKLFKSFMEMGK